MNPAPCVNFLQRFVGLPHDSFKLVPVPDPIGGVLVLSMNAIIYLNQHCTRGVSLNGLVQSVFFVVVPTMRACLILSLSLSCAHQLF